MTHINGVAPASAAWTAPSQGPAELDGKQTLLLVDDAATDAFLLAHALAKSDLRLKMHWVASGEEALDYLAGAGPFADRQRYALPDVVVLDLVLPQMNGLEFLRFRCISAALGRVPVVVWSGSLNPAWKERALALGARAFVPKRATAEQWSLLVTEVAAALRRAGQPPLPPGPPALANV